jgi:Ca2+-binding RTX toxin-like protein
MENLGHRASRASRLAYLIAAAVATIAVIGAAAGLAAGEGRAAPPPPIKPPGAPVPPAPHGRADLRHGLLSVEGTPASDSIALRLKAGDPDFVQVDFGDDGTAEFTFKRSDVEQIAVGARAGDDHVRIDESNGAFTNGIPTTIDGGAGNDTLAGGSGVETLNGGPGNDTVDGNGGNDVALLGNGDDTFVWDPGDGSDKVEGQNGNDTMRFNGANVAEKVELSANRNRLELVRDLGSITMDTASLENVDFNALGGADVVTVDDLSGTGVKAVNVDLASALGGTTADGATDRVVVNGTNHNDTIAVNGNQSAAAVTGLPALVTVEHQDPTDLLDVDGLGGNDEISATGLAAQSIALLLDGGVGNDALDGGPGVETLSGGDGNDAIDGNGGNDAALMGAGDDTFVWDPGDGSDTIEGGDGSDTMLFNGANVDEQVVLSANGNRLRFFRTQGNITMDTAGVETVDFNALGGADLVTVDDLSGTDVKSVNIDLAGTPGGTSGDGQPDHVVVNGTAGDDAINVNGDAGGVKVSGLAAGTELLHAEPGDRLDVNTLDGSDSVDSGGLAAGTIQLFVDGVLVP